MLRAALEHVRGRELPGPGAVPGAEVDRHLPARLDGRARRRLGFGLGDRVVHLRLGHVVQVDVVLVELVESRDVRGRLRLVERGGTRVVSAQLEQLADRGGDPTRRGRDRVEHAPHRDSRREQEPEQTEPGEDHRGGTALGRWRARIEVDGHVQVGPGKA